MRTRELETGSEPRFEPPPIRIGICGEVYSTNLGDRVIADSLSYLIRTWNPNASICFIDLTDRPRPPDCPSQERQPLSRAPSLIAIGKLRHIPGLFGITPKLRWWRQVREVARTACAWVCPFDPPSESFDLTIFGGGQLLMDTDLWFPTRLCLQRHRLDRHSRYFAVYACGVGTRWSRLGKYLCRQLLADDRLIARTVRDPSSLDRAVEDLGCARDSVSLTPDPGFWAAEAYNISKHAASNLIGMGVMAPPHAVQGTDPKDAKMLNRSFLKPFWKELIVSLSSIGHPVHVFTNGDPDDFKFASEIYDQLPTMTREKVHLVPRPTHPQELVETISHFRAMVASRLHALIIGHSLGIPSVGLIWDEKIRQFGKQIGSPGRMLDQEKIATGSILQKLNETLSHGIDEESRSTLRENARQGVVDLITLLETLKGR